jgi:hypothetical protein
VVLETHQKLSSTVTHRLHLLHQRSEAVRIEAMKRTSVTIADDIERALEAYERDQDIPPRLVDVVQAALREYLAGRGYLPTSGRSRSKPKGVPRDRRVRIEGPDNLGAAVIEDRR